MYDYAHAHYVTWVRYSNSAVQSAESANDVGSDVLAYTSLDGYCLLWDKRQKFPAHGKLPEELIFSNCYHSPNDEFVDSSLSQM